MACGGGDLPAALNPRERESTTVREREQRGKLLGLQMAVDEGCNGGVWWRKWLLFFASSNRERRERG